MSKVKDRTGQKFNKWRIIKFVGFTKGGEARWLCECDCGFRKVQTIGNVTGGYSRCCKICSRVKNYRGEILPQPVWKTIITNASKKGRKVEINKQFAESLFMKQSKKCAISGMDIRFAESNKEYNEGKQTASLDRIDSSGNYTENNIQWVHKDINKMKNVFSMDQLIEYCKKIVDHHNNKTN
jgi:hypothetical protein